MNRQEKQIAVGAIKAYSLLFIPMCQYPSSLSPQHLNDTAFLLLSILINPNYQLIFFFFSIQSIIIKKKKTDLGKEEAQAGSKDKANGLLFRGDLYSKSQRVRMTVVLELEKSGFQIAMHGCR